MDKAWVVEGARVAILSHRLDRDVVTVTTISRLTATQVVCANSIRFRRATLRIIGDSYGPELRPMTDDQVKDALMYQYAEALSERAENLWRIVRTIGWTGVADYLNGMEKAVRNTRAAIDQLLEGKPGHEAS